MSIKPKPASPLSPERKARAKPASKAVSATAVLAGQQGTKRVLSATVKGGFRVFDTPVEPRHTTRERIAEAVAAFK